MEIIIYCYLKLTTEQNIEKHVKYWLLGKLMLQILSITFVQVKAGNNSEILLKEIRQILYLLYQSKEITKKVYNNIIK